MRFAAGLTITGALSFIVLEALKIIMVPVTAWVMGLLAVGLKIVLIALAAVLGLVGLALAIGLGVFFYNRSQKNGANA